MTGSGPSIEEQLRAVREEFVADLPRRLRAIDDGWRMLVGEGWNIEMLDEVHRLVHNLTGAGRTFGFDDLSELARRLEVLLVAARACAERPAAATLSEMEDALGSLRAVIAVCKADRS